MQRSMSKEKYVAAAVITIIIFFLGFMVGLVMEGKRASFVDNAFADQNVDLSSSQIQYAYVTTLDSKESCPAIYDIFYQNLEDLEDTRVRLVQYAKESRINDDAFNLLKRRYSIEQVRYWLLSQQARDVCGEDLVTVLYFYSDDIECPKCADQEFVLNYVKDLLGQQVLIFALDAQFDNEPMISILKSRYNVDVFPSLVIEDTSFLSFQGREVIIDEVCSKFSDVPEACV